MNEKRMVPHEMYPLKRITTFCKKWGIDSYKSMTQVEEREKEMALNFTNKPRKAVYSPYSKFLSFFSFV